MVHKNIYIINSWFLACLYWDTFFVRFRRDTHEIFAEPVDPNEVCIWSSLSSSYIMGHFIFHFSFAILMEICVLTRLKITTKSLKSLWILAPWGLNFMKECIEVLNNLRFASTSTCGCVINKTHLFDTIFMEVWGFS
jgi:hypothetical protein